MLIKDFTVDPKSATVLNSAEFVWGPKGVAEVSTIFARENTFAFVPGRLEAEISMSLKQFFVRILSGKFGCEFKEAAISIGDLQFLKAHKSVPDGWRAVGYDVAIKNCDTEGKIIPEIFAKFFVTGLRFLGNHIRRNPNYQTFGERMDFVEFTLDNCFGVNGVFSSSHDLQGAETFASGWNENQRHERILQVLLRRIFVSGGSQISVSKMQSPKPSYNVSIGGKNFQAICLQSSPVDLNNRIEPVIQRDFVIVDSLMNMPNPMVKLRVVSNYQI